MEVESLYLRVSPHPSSLQVNVELQFQLVITGLKTLPWVSIIEDLPGRPRRELVVTSPGRFKSVNRYHIRLDVLHVR